MLANVHPVYLSQHPGRDVVLDRWDMTFIMRDPFLVTLGSGENHEFYL